MFTTGTPLWPWLLSNGPVYLVMIVGIVLSLQYSHRFPRAARLSLLGFSILLLNSLVGTYLSQMLPKFLFEQGSSAESIGLVLGLRAVIQSLISAAGFGFLLAAIFSGRRDET